LFALNGKARTLSEKLKVILISKCLRICIVILVRGSPKPGKYVFQMLGSGFSGCTLSLIGDYRLGARLRTPVTDERLSSPSVWRGRPQVRIEISGFALLFFFSLYSGLIVSRALATVDWKQISLWGVLRFLSPGDVICSCMGCASLSHLPSQYLFRLFIPINALGWRAVEDCLCYRRRGKP